MLKTHLRPALVLLFCAILLVGFSWSSFRMERLRDNGDTVLLELAPVDPLALLLGYYMDLNYGVDRDISYALDRKDFSQMRNGLAVVRLDEHRVAEFVRLDDGTPLAPDEMKLFFRLRGGQAYTGASSYFFQEGLAEAYEQAEYGEYRVSANGKMLLTYLVDAQFQRIKPKPGGAGAPAQPK